METDTKFNRLKDYLNNMEVYPDETEMEDIISLAIQQEAYEANKGYRFDRTAHNPREMAFYEVWLKWNEPRSGTNHGNGILQDLLIETTGDFRSRKTIEVINNRDRYIVATIIQWLGTNVGMSFLHEALRKFNAHIVEERKEL